MITDVIYLCKVNYGKMNNDERNIFYFIMDDKLYALSHAPPSFVRYFLYYGEHRENIDSLGIEDKLTQGNYLYEYDCLDDNYTFDTVFTYADLIFNRNNNMKVILGE